MSKSLASDKDTIEMQSRTRQEFLLLKMLQLSQMASEASFVSIQNQPIIEIMEEKLQTSAKCSSCISNPRREK
jgi:hypothetical protein